MSIMQSSLSKLMHAMRRIQGWQPVQTWPLNNASKVLWVSYNNIDIRPQPTNVLYSNLMLVPSVWRSFMVSPAAVCASGLRFVSKSLYMSLMYPQSVDFALCLVLTSNTSLLKNVKVLTPSGHEPKRRRTVRLSLSLRFSKLIRRVYSMATHMYII